MECALAERLGESACRLDGDIDKDARQAVIDRFQADTGARVMLLTLSTGGVGLNLTRANHVIALEGWWNPAVMEQAVDRCHRITQTKEVSTHSVLPLFSSSLTNAPLRCPMALLKARCPPQTTCLCAHSDLPRTAGACAFALRPQYLR